LLADDSWQAESDDDMQYEQGYVSTAVPGQTVRVRIAGENGYLTLKGPTTGLPRDEWEYEIPISDAQAMLETLCSPNRIRKKRYLVKTSDHLIWEIHVFESENAGLIIAEFEINSTTQAIELLSWVGTEVSEDPRYFNANLVESPYSTW